MLKPETGCSAADDLTAVSKTTDDRIIFFISGYEKKDTVKVQAGNRIYEDVTVKNVKKMDSPIKTLILLDNSLSLSKLWGDEAIQLIEKIIDGHADNEEFRIATFADGLTEISEYSSKYKTLVKKVKKIEYYNQSSYLTGILHDVLREIEQSKDESFYRIIIITDGADDEEIKYHADELVDVIKKSGVVINSIGVNGTNKGALENLFYYSRLTGGESGLVDSQSNLDNICADLNNDYKRYAIIVEPDEAEKDGSKKAVKITVSGTDKQKEYITEASMPFGSGIVPVATPTPEPTATVAPTPTPEPTPTLTPTPKTSSELPTISTKKTEKKTEEVKEESNLRLIIIIAAAVAFVVILIIIIIILAGRKKKKAKANKANDYYEEEKPIEAPYIILHELNGANEYTAHIGSKILIGRERGDIVIKDGAVSAEHCEIYRKGSLYYVKDLNSSNGTFYDGIRTNGLTPIIDGGKLRMGTKEYSITIREDDDGNEEGTMLL